MDLILRYRNNIAYKVEVKIIKIHVDVKVSKKIHKHHKLKFMLKSVKIVRTKHYNNIVQVVLILKEAMKVCL